LKHSIIMMSSIDSNDDEDNARMAQDDRCWNGNWSSAGLCAMFVNLDSESLEKEEWEEFLAEQQLKEKSKSPSLRVEDEFINLDIPGDDQESWARLHMRILQPRGLHIASGVVRRVVEDLCPTRIRIRKLDDEEFKELLEQKKAGNEAFSNKRYEEAIEKYDDALMLVDSLFVAPKSQVEQIVNVLSNQAECYLRLREYEDAGQAATDALMFDDGHGKSRMRRAKAALAIAGSSYLIQAQVDLEAIVNDEEGQDNNISRPGSKQAKDYLEQLEEMWHMEKTTLLEKHGSDYDWDLYVGMMKAKCW
jgi:tetratricopeptide (TPR) repeat protein